MRELSDEDLDRYARHIVLKEIGGEGQRKLLAASVLVVGAGGLGSPCLFYLAAAGIGRLGIVDDDRVALSNLQRQILYRTGDVGGPKVQAAQDALMRLNPSLEIETHELRLDDDNVADLVARYDIVADGSDNFPTRLAVADAALAARVPLVSAAIAQFEGQLGTFRGWEPHLPCYRCFVGDPNPQADINCADQGILGAVAGIIGTFQALEVIREIVGFGSSLAGRLLTFDAMSCETRILKLPKLPSCLACAGHA